MFLITYILRHGYFVVPKMHPVPWSIGKSCGGRWKGAPSSPEAERKKLSICSCSIRRAWPDCTVDLKLRVDDTTLLKHTETIPRVCYLWRLNIIHLRVLHFMGPSKSSISVANKKRLIHGGAPPFDGHVSTCFARHVLLDLSAIIKFASPPPLQATSSSSSCSSMLFSSFHFSILPDSTLASQRHMDLYCRSIICANGTKLV